MINFSFLFIKFNKIIIIVFIDNILLSNHVKELIDKNVVWFYSLVACISIL